MPSHSWRGASGRLYPYEYERLPAPPATNAEGNYTFAKVIGNRWHTVYVGQGKLRDRYDAAIREGCVTRKSATHYHWHLNASEAAREQEESDIIRGNSECRAPTGCNERG